MTGSAPLVDIAAILRGFMGLNAAAVGMSCVAYAVRERMERCRIDDLPGYHHALLSSPEELDALIECVVVGETWFFRVPEAFRALQHYAQREWLPSHRFGRLRILSLPCATGEEPYSIAMALLDAGIEPQQLAIDAIDISRRNLAAAQQARYESASFRGTDLAFRDVHFVPEEGQYALRQAPRSLVQFACGNLIAPGFATARGLYDVVFCRNLLIYFDREIQQRAIGVLNQLLAPNGMLFVGHAEGSVLREGFAPCRDFPGAFGFIRRRADAPVPSSCVHSASAAASHPRVRPIKAEVRPFAPHAQEAPPPAAAAQDEDGLVEARHCANAGHFAEAALLCEQHLAAHGPTAPAYYLLALVRDAVGSRDQAETYLRRAAYLDPEHYETLVHLALLCEQAGQHDTAAHYRRRAERVLTRRDGQPAQGAT